MAKITDLPDDIIYMIISYLSAKSAAYTKILSKKWQDRVLIFPDIVFDQSINDIPSFQLIVYLVLASHIKNRIRRLSLKFQSLDDSQSKLVNDCLRDVVKRSVMDLELKINVKVKDAYTLPLEIFACRTVVKLELGSGFVIDMIPKNALLQSLKTLILDSVKFDDLNGCAFQRLLSVCPVITELVIDGVNWEYWKWSRVVSSLTLERLTIRRKEWSHYDESAFESISFDTPSLTYLDYADFIPYEYPIVNLSSLIEAKLKLPRGIEYYGVDRSIDPTNLLKGLRNIESLSIDALNSSWRLFGEFRIPMFENLNHLSVISEPESCWDVLQILLEKSPKLKTLTIQGALHFSSEDGTDIEPVCSFFSIDLSY